MAESYNITNIRLLLTEGFTDDELRTLCYETPEFKPVYDKLAENTGKAKIIQQLIEHAERRLKLDLLLNLAREYNPDMYKKHQPYVEGMTSETASSDSINDKSQVVKESHLVGTIPISNPLKDELQELEQDYETKTSEIKTVRQQIRETIDLSQLESLKNRLERLNQERREINQKIIGAQQSFEFEIQPIAVSEIQTPVPVPNPITSRAKDILSWKQNFARPPAILHPHSQISVILQGYDPFPRASARNERDFLFGEVGGFWSWHPLYLRISANFAPEIILADVGTGKTAFAHALIQLGDGEGRPIAQTLPIFIDGPDATFQKVQTQLADDLLDFVRANPTKLSGLTTNEKKLLARLWLSGTNTDRIQVRLREIIMADPGLADIIDQAGGLARLKQKDWPEQVKLGLELLGFERALLAFDFNQQSTRGIKFCLQRMPDWVDHSLIIKAFLPLNLPPGLEPFLTEIETSTLTWDKKMITQLTQWRFERLANLADIHIRPEDLFEGDLYDQFIQQAGNNPRRLARLWRKLFDDHLAHTPDSNTFSSANLTRAVENLK